MSEQLTRNEIAEEMKWDLSTIYTSIEKWEADFSRINGLVTAVLAFKGKLGDSPQTLADCYKTQDAMERVVEKIYTYAHLESDQDTAKSETRSRVDRITSKFAEISGKLAWFDPELLALPEETFSSYLEAEELSFYNRTLQEQARSRAHTLSEKEERILGMSSEVMGAASKAFSILNNADIKFPKIKDDDGNDVELTHGSYVKFLESGDREIRKGAFNAMYDTYNSYRNTFACTMGSNVKKDVLKAELRNFPSALESSLHPDNVPADVYNNLISTVHSNLPALHRYYDLRRKVLKLDKLDMCDVYNPLIAESKIEVSWEEACQWVREACKPLGEEYCTILERAFEERWIDVLENKGKRSGAYSSGCHDTSPYVLMNYSGTLNDVFTLAHELGHSMHSYYSRNAQPYHYSSYKIFVAEVASTTNELLLHDYLMKKTEDKNFRLYLLNHLVDGFKGTVYRQTMFAEFEKEIHERVERGEPLTPDNLCEYYYELNKKYHGDAVEPDQKIEMEWARIPHFYYNFYVYKYATGFSAAVALSKNILSGDQKKLDDYLGFLKAGGSKDVLDIMKDAGVDLSTPEPINSALTEFSGVVDELERELVNR